MEAIVGTGAVIGLLWGAALLRFGGLTAGLLAAVLTAIVLNFQVLTLPTGVFDMTIDRIVAGLVVVQYAYWRMRHGADRRPVLVDYLLLALVAWLVVSAILFPPASGTATGKLLCYYLIPLGLYFVARQTVRTETSATAIAIFFAVLGCYLAVTAFLEHLQLWSLLVPSYIGSPKYPEFLGRARGPLMNPAANGFLLISCGAAAASLWSATGRLGRGAIALTLLLICGAAYLTLTRSVWIGAALSVGLFALVALPRRFLAAGTLFGASLVLPLVFADWDGVLSLKRDRGLDAAASADSVKLRPILAYIAWSMFREHPLTGCGFGGYDEAKLDFLHDRTVDLALQKGIDYVQHNVVLSLLTETGLIGMSLYVAVLTLWSIAAWRLWRSNGPGPQQRRLGFVFLVFMVNYLTNGMFHDVTIMQAVHVILFFMAGVVEGLAVETAVITTSVMPTRRSRVGMLRSATHPS